MHRFGWVIAIFVIDRSNSITWGHCKQHCRSDRDVLKVPTDMSFRSASKYREHGGKSTTPIRCSPYVSREPTVTGRNIGIHSRTMAERQAPRINPTAELPYEYIRDCLLSLKITPNPNRVWVLLHPFVTCNVRCASKKDGLCIKNTENAPIAASAIEYWVLSPVLRSGKRSVIERKCSTSRLKTAGCSPDRKGKLIASGIPVVLSHCVIQTADRFV